MQIQTSQSVAVRKWVTQAAVGIAHDLAGLLARPAESRAARGRKPTARQRWRGHALAVPRCSTAGGRMTAEQRYCKRVVERNILGRNHSGMQRCVSDHVRNTTLTVQLRLSCWTLSMNRPSFVLVSSVICVVDAYVSNTVCLGAEQRRLWHVQALAGRLPAIRLLSPAPAENRSGPSLFGSQRADASRETEDNSH